VEFPGRGCQRRIVTLILSVVICGGHDDGWAVNTRPLPILILSLEG